MQTQVLSKRWELGSIGGWMGILGIVYGKSMPTRPTALSRRTGNKKASASPHWQNARFYLLENKGSIPP
jgi:hypothetical protein